MPATNVSKANILPLLHFEIGIRTKIDDLGKKNKKRKKDFLSITIPVLFLRSQLQQVTAICTAWKWEVEIMLPYHVLTPAYLPFNLCLRRYENIGIYCKP